MNRMNAWAAQTWTILRISLQERLIYRAEFALSAALRFLPILTRIFLWLTVYAVVGSQGNTTIAGYDRDAMIGYYLLTMLVRLASAAPGVSTQIAREIRTGTFRRYLVQPIDFLGFTFLNQLAHKAVYFLSGMVPLSIMLWCCRGFLPSLPSAPVLVMFAVSASLAFLLAFLIDAILGVIGFWFLDISSLLFVYTGTIFFFSGQMFPLELLPGGIGVVAQWLPMRFFIHFPTAILLGRLTPEQIGTGLGAELAWVVGSLALLRILFHFGVRRYEGYGG